MKYVNCEKLIKVSLPAIRVALASALTNKYGIGQDGIADRLGITQASVSKYLSRRYSGDIARLSAALGATTLIKGLAKEAASSNDYPAIQELINRYASGKLAISAAKKLFGAAAFE